MLLLVLAFSLAGVVTGLSPILRRQSNESISLLVTAPATSRSVSPQLYGYSFEPSSFPDYIASTLASTLLGQVADTIGLPADIRVGGNSADYTYFHPNQTEPYEILPNKTVIKAFNISKGFYDSFADYFPSNTSFTYTLNFADNTSAWANALLEASAVYESLGSSLKLIELGNEIDHFANEGYRELGHWNTTDYIPQWFNLSGQITSTSWYESSTTAPKFQAAVFADPPLVPDQQDENDDFDIVNVTRNGLVDPAIISTYSVHLYPQSTCDAPRAARLSLNLLSDHSVLYKNVSQYIPEVAAAEAAGARLVMGETNSASCSGRSGISDTFTAALWSVDYVLLAASLGFEKVFFHLGSSSEYSAFVPLPYEYKNESLSAGIRANWYSHWFIAQVLADNANLSIFALPQANTSDFSGYALYDQESGELDKVVLLDMGVWNSSTGVSNPSTLSTTDSNSTSPGERPVRTVSLTTSWGQDANVSVIRMQAPGSNAKSDVTVGGTSFDPTSGELIGTIQSEQLNVSSDGVVQVSLERAEAALISIK